MQDFYTELMRIDDGLDLDLDEQNAVVESSLTRYNSGSFRSTETCYISLRPREIGQSNAVSSVLLALIAATLCGFVYENSLFCFEFFCRYVIKIANNEVSALIF